MSLSGPEGHRLVIAQPEGTDPTKPGTLQRRTHCDAGRYDLRRVVQARALMRVQILGSRPGEVLTRRREFPGHQKCHCRND